MLTQIALERDLTALGLRDGDMAMVHAGMRSVGRLIGGPDTLIAALRAVLGTGGTLVGYPSWEAPYEELLDERRAVPAEWRDHVPGFDPATGRAARDNGAFQEFLRTTPGTLRSANPGASISAIGARAAWLTADHPLDYGYGDGTPLARLVEGGGRVLMIGAPHDTCTLLHLAEHRARIPGKRVLSYDVALAGAGGTRWVRIEEFDTSEPVLDAMPTNMFEIIVDAYLASGEGAQGKVGQAPSTLMDAAPLLDFAVRWIETRYGGLDAG